MMAMHSNIFFGYQKLNCAFFFFVLDDKAYV